MEIKKEKTRGEQICLLKKDKYNKLVFNNESLEILKRIKGNFGTCVCVGPYRQGKSYLLSQLIGNTNNGFKIGHTDESCTKGVWMWSQPITINTKNGPANLLLFDTEGLESDESNQEWDTNLFLVSLIMSSMFLYNTKNALTAEAFKKLAAVTSFSQKVSFKSNATSKNNSKILKDEFCPTFTWIIRDFSLISLITPREKLEKFLRPEEFIENPDMNFSQNEKKKHELMSKNLIRDNMKSAFKTLDCFYFPVPVTDGTNNMSYETALANLHKLPINVLREPFQKALNGFKKHIEETFEFKKINQTEMTGPVFVEFLKQIVHNINNNEQICLMDALDASHKIVANEILIKAKENYENEMEDLISNNTMPLIWDDFDEEEDAIFIQCEDLIKSSNLNTAILNETLTNFKEYIRNSQDSKRKGTLIYYNEINRNEIEKKNGKTFKMLWNNKFNEKLNNPIQYYATKLELQNEIDQLKADIEVQMVQCDDFNQLWLSNLSNLKVESILNDIDIANKKKLDELEKKRQEEEKEKKRQQDLDNRYKEAQIKKLEEEIRRNEQEKENQIIRQAAARINCESSQKKLYLRKDGLPNCSYKENRVGFVNDLGEKLNKNGTPDMRCRANKIKYGQEQNF